MAAALKKIDSVDILEHQKDTRPLLIFKHSNTCGISLCAKEEIEAYVAQGLYDVHMLVVQEQRPLSNQISESLGVRHASPQLLIVTAHGVEALSHYGITMQGIIAKTK